MLLTTMKDPDQVDLVETLTTLWAGRWLVAWVTALLVVLATLYVFIAPMRFRAEALLMPADPRAAPGLMDSIGDLGGLSGLVSLAGVQIGGGDTAEPLAVLTSPGFARAFIEDEHLLPILFAEEWDARAGRWKSVDPEEWPDIHDAVRKFDRDIRRVREDRRTKLITLSIEWTDPEVAATWANLLVDRLNERMRRRSLEEAEASIAYLEKELTTTEVVTMQQSIGHLLQSELQKSMLARVNKEFALKVIDRAAAPKWRFWPKRTLTVAAAFLVGFIFSTLLVLFRAKLRRYRNSALRAAQ